MNLFTNTDRKKQNFHEILLYHFDQLYLLLSSQNQKEKTRTKFGIKTYRIKEKEKEKKILAR